MEDCARSDRRTGRLREGSGARNNRLAIVEKVCGNTALAIEELKSRVPMVARGGRLTLERRLTSASCCANWRIDRRCDPIGKRRREIRPRRCRSARGRGVQRGRSRWRGGSSRSDGRPRPRRPGRAHEATRRRDGARGRRSVHTREVLESALAEAHLELPLAIAGDSKLLVLAESGAAAMLEAAADRSRLASVIRLVDGYEALAAAAASMPRIREMREYLAGTGLRAAPDEARGPGKFLATNGHRFAGDRMRTVAGRARAANFDRSSAQPRCVGSALSEIQMDVRAVLPERACAMAEKMDRLELLAGDARRYFNALARLNAIAALGRPKARIWVRGWRNSRVGRAVRVGRFDRARNNDNAAMPKLRVSAGRVVAAGGTRRT